MPDQRRHATRLLLSVALVGCLATGLSGCDRAAHDAAQAYAKGDFAKAFELYSKTAQASDPDSQFTLGLMYFEGTGVEKDFAEAARWYRRAANQGQTMAQNNLAAMLLEGKGVPRDYVEAAFWFTLVANSGDAHAKMLRDSAAAHLSITERDAVRDKAATWKPTKEHTGLF